MHLKLVQCEQKSTKQKQKTDKAASNTLIVVLKILNWYSINGKVDDYLTGTARRLFTPF
jgi:hypothetical protein